MPGNYNIDHSSIYINGNATRIINNLFTNAVAGNITAIELHGQSVQVVGNTQQTGGGFLILASDIGNAGGYIANNTATNSLGIVLWPFAYTISNVTIHANTMPPIYGVPHAGKAFHSITIDGNNLSAINPTSSTVGGIYFGGPIANLTVMNNTFNNLGGYGVWLSMPSGDYTSGNITIRNNYFNEICQYSAGTYYTAIWLQGGSYKGVDCYNNSFTGSRILTYFRVDGYDVADILFLNQYPFKDTGHLPVSIIATHSITEPIAMDWRWRHLFYNNMTYVGVDSIVYDANNQPWKRSGKKW